MVALVNAAPSSRKSDCGGQLSRHRSMGARGGGPDGAPISIRVEYLIFVSETL